MFVSGEFRRNVYLTVKEALHNIVKHSGASKVDIRVEAGKQLFISIHDNGKGFDEKNIRPFSNGIHQYEETNSYPGRKPGDQKHGWQHYHTGRAPTLTYVLLAT